MGYGMAMNLATKMPADARLIINDINTTQVTKFLDEIKLKGIDASRITAAKTPSDIASEASIILTSLPHGEAVIEVYTNPTTGLASNLSAASATQPPPKLFIETSTIPISASTPARSAITALGHAFLDAPVSGGIPIAAAGTLTVMAGGSDSDFHLALPVMSTYATSSNIFHCGGPGAGLATKQINNYVAMCSFIGLCEGMNTGIRYGLDPNTLGRIINVSSGMSWNSLHMNPVKGVVEGSSSNKDFAPGFPTELARGVMGQGRELMRIVGAKSILGGKVEGLFEKAVGDERCKGRECRSVWRLWEGEGEGLGGLVDESVQG